MKRIALPLFLALLSGFMARPARAEWGRTYVAGPRAQPVQPLPREGATPTGEGTAPIAGSSSWWFGPSVGIDVAQIDLRTRQYTVGVIPGIGYGIKWCPAGWTATSAVLALDLFVQAGLVDETNTTPGARYFTIEATPILTVLDWVSVGFGPDAYIGVSTLPSELHWMLSFGVKKST